ncbi:MAG: ParB/RepB/Spo0J family partition protein [Caldilineaceae bacterium]|nr:ParB/RepB/Spo0J family partition protein [Caldilineaceae bacterium]
MNNSNSPNNTPARRRGLGRGLGALIVDTTTARQQEQEEARQAEGVQLCAIDAILPNPQQPRTTFDETALQELATSIQTHGIIQPLIVTANPQIPHTYWLIAGERRWRAARLAALTEVPILVREASPQQLVELALIENIQRADLNPIEEGSAYLTLVEQFGLTHAEVAERVGKSRSAITNTVRLLQAPISLQKAVTDGVISAGHARALLALKEADQLEQILQLVIQQDLNVRQTEALVKRLTEAATTESPAEMAEPNDDPQTGHLEARFRSALGTRVNLSRNANGSGRLVIHFYNDDDLDNLYQLIAGGDEE